MTFGMYLITRLQVGLSFNVLHVLNKVLTFGKWNKKFFLYFKLTSCIELIRNAVNNRRLGMWMTTISLTGLGLIVDCLASCLLCSWCSLRSVTFSPQFKSNPLNLISIIHQVWTRADIFGLVFQSCKTSFGRWLLIRQHFGQMCFTDIVTRH